ncbi:MAG: PRC-barrel domain-containing protein [Phycisphaerales bacterium JB052]
MNRMIQSTKQTRPALIANSVLALALAAGSATALSGPEQTKRSTTSSTVNNDARLLHFARADTLIGSDLMNNASDSIGTVSDFIVDRGSGQIEFAIVKSGDFLGIGGESFALLYNELRYFPASTGFQTNLSEEQLQRRTEFIPENWEELDDTNWMQTASDWFSDNDADHNEDAMREAMRDGEREEIAGRVTKVTRKSYKGQEQVFLTIEDEDQEEHNLILGPSWYVMGLEDGVHRDDQIEFSVVEYGDYAIVAEGKVNRQSVTLRDSEGKGVWETKNTDKASQYVLLSDIIGMRAEMVGSTVGEIQTALIEGGSGQVAMLALDPNENLFGLGDELSLIPWAATSLPVNAYIIIDGNDAKLERALEMPSDVSTLRTPSSVNHAYTVFGLDMPKFKARDNTAPPKHANRDHNAMHHGDAWSNNSKLISALRDGEEIQLEGKYKGMTTQSIVKGAPEARVLMITTENGTQRLIVGPTWFSDRQKLDFDNGDTLSIHAKRATINGQEWLCVTDIDDGDNQWSFWNDDSPAWSN